MYDEISVSLLNDKENSCKIKMISVLFEKRKKKNVINFMLYIQMSIFIITKTTIYNTFYQVRKHVTNLLKI